MRPAFIAATATDVIVIGSDLASVRDPMFRGCEIELLDLRRSGTGGDGFPRKISRCAYPGVCRDEKSPNLHPCKGRRSSRAHSARRSPSCRQE